MKSKTLICCATMFVSMFIFFSFGLGVVHAQVTNDPPRPVGSACLGNFQCASGICFTSTDSDNESVGICLEDNSQHLEPCSGTMQPLANYCPGTYPRAPWDFTFWSLVREVGECSDHSVNNDGVEIDLDSDLGETPAVFKYCEQYCPDGETITRSTTPPTCVKTTPDTKRCKDPVTGNTSVFTNTTSTGEFPFSIMCYFADENLQSNTTSTVGASCTTTNSIQTKCERICLPGFYFSSNPNGTGGSCKRPNVFGWAWSSNVGWIKMNNCDANTDGTAKIDTCSGPDYGMNIDDNVSSAIEPRKLSGYAWNNRIGWIKFGNSLGVAPVVGGVQSVSSMTLNNASDNAVGTFSGWARKVVGSACSETPSLYCSFFDGWLSFAGANYLSGNTNGTGGVTYDKSTGRIVGSAWGGPVLGWVKFGDNTNAWPKVTYGVSTQAFSYSLFVFDFTPDFHIFANGETTQQITTTIRLRLLLGNTQIVSLSKQLFGGQTDLPTVSLGKTSCSPTDSSECDIELTVKVLSTTTTGSYSVKITSTSSGVADQTKTVTFRIPSNTQTDPKFSATCKIDNLPPYYVNKPVTWLLSIKTSPRYSNLTSVTLASPISARVKEMLPLARPTTATEFFLPIIYSTTGVKTARYSVAYDIPGQGPGDSNPGNSISSNRGGWVAVFYRTKILTGLYNLIAGVAGFGGAGANSGDIVNPINSATVAISGSGNNNPVIPTINVGTCVPATVLVQPDTHEF